MGLKLRRDTAANWTSDNPTLEQGEQGYETDTGKLKIGDGTTAWTSLAYWADTSGLVPNTRTVNGHALSANVTVTAADVSAVPTTRTVNGHPLSADVTVSRSDLSLPSPGYSALLTSEQTVNGGGGTGDQALWTPAAIPAANLAVGQVYELEVAGNFDNVATSGLFTLDVKIGSSLVASVGIVSTSQTSAATVTPWWAKLLLRLDAVGSSGTVTVTGNSTVVTTAGAGINPRAIRQVTTGLTLTTSLAPSAAGKLATANAGNIIRLTSALLRQVA